MKSLFGVIVVFAFAAKGFASEVDQEAGPEGGVHSQICEKIKEAKPTIDLDSCERSGQVFLGGYNSEEAVYQLQDVKLYKNKKTIYFCIASAGEAGLIFEHCEIQR